MQTLNFQLTGVSCASCAGNIESALSKEPAIKNLRINIASKTLSLETDLSADTIIELIHKAGYGAQIMTEDSDKNEHKKTKNVFKALLFKGIFAGVLGGFLFIVGLFDILPPLYTPLGKLIWFIIGVITLISVIISGGHIYKSAYKTLKNKHITMDTLVMLSTAIAWLYSMAIVINPNIVPQGSQHIYFEAAIFILCFIDIGKALEVKALSKTGDAIKKLLNLQSKTALIIRDNQTLELPFDQIILGDIIQVRPGEKVATDGKIIEGQSNIDESMITGEPMPVLKKAGDLVIGGTINKTGSFRFKATRIGKETVLSQIIELVKNAQNTKPPVARIADAVVSVFVPAIIIIALLTAGVWLFVGPPPQSSFALLTAMSVLVIACPCALGLAVPISIMIAMGKAAQAGILIRNGNALEQTCKITLLVLDKTGTVTQGNPKVTEVVLAKDCDQETLFQYAASLESLSKHPLASAILEKTQNSQTLPVTHFQEIEGKGLIGSIHDKIFRAGSLAMMQEAGIDLSALKNDLGETKQTAGTLVMIADTQQALGYFIIQDPIKKDSKEAIKTLHTLGIKTLMLTGDNERAARAIAKEAGIDEVAANLMPQDKIAYIEKRQAQGEIVGMVGDGINDAPALAKAHIGFAIGNGTDVAIESADITLMRNSLMGVPKAIEISKRTMRNVKQNLFGAFIYNIICIPVAAGVLYPFFGILLNPAMAAAAMALSDLTVISNALRLRKIK